MSVYSKGKTSVLEINVKMERVSTDSNVCRAVRKIQHRLHKRLHIVMIKHFNKPCFSRPFLGTGFNFCSCCCRQGSLSAVEEPNVIVRVMYLNSCLYNLLVTVINYNKKPQAIVKKKNRGRSPPDYNIAITEPI